MTSIRAAAEDRLPVVYRLQAILKTLTYDQNLKVRCPDGLKIGVVSMSGDNDSLAVAKEMAAEIGKNLKKKVKGLSMSAESIEAKSASEIWKTADEKGLNVLYLSSGLDKILDKLVGFARHKKILLVTGEAAYMAKGVAIGVVQRDQKPLILINAEAAAAQGVKLDEKLLEMKGKGVELIQPQ